jgi:hypothetical protein
MESASVLGKELAHRSAASEFLRLFIYDNDGHIVTAKIHLHYQHFCKQLMVLG